MYEYETGVLSIDHDGGCGCRSACHLDIEIADADAEFIANARADIAALIAEVRRLRAIIDRLDAMHQPDEYGGGSAEYADGVGCTTCEYVDWPCPTHTALHPEEETRHA